MDHVVFTSVCVSGGWILCMALYRNTSFPSFFLSFFLSSIQPQHDISRVITSLSPHPSPHPSPAPPLHIFGLRFLFLFLFFFLGADAKLAMYAPLGSLTISKRLALWSRAHAVCNFLGLVWYGMVGVIRRCGFGTDSWLWRECRCRCRCGRSC